MHICTIWSHPVVLSLSETCVVACNGNEFDSGIFFAYPTDPSSIHTEKKLWVVQRDVNVQRSYSHSLIPCRSATSTYMKVVHGVFFDIFTDQVGCMCSVTMHAVAVHIPSDNAYVGCSARHHGRCMVCWSTMRLFKFPTDSARCLASSK